MYVDAKTVAAVRARGPYVAGDVGLGPYAAAAEAAAHDGAILVALPLRVPLPTGSRRQMKTTAAPVLSPVVHRLDPVEPQSHVALLGAVERGLFNAPPVEGIALESATRLADFCSHALALAERREAARAADAARRGGGVDQTRGRGRQGG